MIGKFLRRLAGGDAAPGSDKGPAVAASEQYEGFELQARPLKESEGWRVAGSIVREVDGEMKRHDFIRADTCVQQEDAIAFTLRKARQIVDERGVRMFDR